MKTRKIGNLEVSNVGMGCMGFSHGYGKVPEKEYSVEAIRKAYASGCTFFDTAETYGREQFWPGHNEQIVGEAIRPFRESVVLATKLHIEDGELNLGEETEQIIRRHLKKSMENLQTDWIDLYYLHRINEKVPMEEVAEAMGKLIAEGKIRGWGLSQVGVDTIRKVQHITPLTAVQNLYSMVERGVEEELMPYLLENNIGLVAFSPVGSGLLSGKIDKDTVFEKTDDVRHFVPQLQKENIEGNQPIVDLLRKFAELKNATPAQMCMAWMIHKYPNTVPIPGSKNQERILENLQAGSIELTEEEFTELEAQLNSCQVFGHRGFEESQNKSFSRNWRK
ncbi:MAG: aldo/keto reductase [Erysipelotrichaceae bacterium]|nr:aldo/keto reductase [Erysipelotrichaceae bacterium]